MDSHLEANEEFIGLYEIVSTAATVIVCTIRDVMTRLNLSISKVRGQCYDGAASMAGHRVGVATQIQQEESRAVYTHCYGHALNLGVSDTVKQCKVIRSAFDIAYEITKLVKKSPRRQAILETLKQELGSDTPGIRILCPTRWTVRADTLQRILANYNYLQLLWEDSLENVREPEMRSRVLGVSISMKSFDFFFGVTIGEMLLRHSDNLSRTLQLPQISAAERQAVGSMNLSTLRTEERSTQFWTNTVQKAKTVNIAEPALPRKRRVPRVCEIGAVEGSFPETVEDHYCLSLTTLNLDSNKVAFQEELKFVCNFYRGDFKEEQLKLHLDILANTLPQSNEHNFHSLVGFIRKLSPAQRALMAEVCTLISMILVMPATNAISERSFSALKRVKTYLRATMSQRRVNSIMMLHVNKDLTDQLSLVDIGNEFVHGSEHRQTLFGKF